MARKHVACYWSRLDCISYQSGVKGSCVWAKRNQLSLQSRVIYYMLVAKANALLCAYVFNLKLFPIVCGGGRERRAAFSEPIGCAALVHLAIRSTRYCKWESYCCCLVWSIKECCSRVLFLRLCYTSIRWAKKGWWDMKVQCIVLHSTPPQ